MELASEQFSDMLAVHEFYVSLLKEELGFEIPVPDKVRNAIARKERHSETDEQIGRWLALLDMAIAPVMVRDGLRESTTIETAEAILRYACRKRSVLDSDRDKADFVITFLFRQAKLPVRILEQWENEETSEFEKGLHLILGLESVQPLPEEHRQLIREFPFIRQEVEEIEHFDRLMDSGVIQRVRDIKERFGTSFYHPHVLAIIAEYNVFIGDRFHELFRKAAGSIKDFARNVELAGGSILARVDGDVTVKQLSELEEDKIFTAEYGRAQEGLRNLSRFKKAVDSRIGSKPISKPMRATQIAGTIHYDVTLPIPAMVHGAGGSSDNLGSRMDRAVEQGKLDSMIHSIRNFVLAADPKAAGVFPMRNGNLTLSPHEIESFRADYQTEKSFRGEFANGMSQGVAILARMTVELDDLRQRQRSAYLWKPHADSLTFLMEAANRLEHQCRAIVQMAEQRGLMDKATAMNATLERLRQQSVAVAKALEGVGAAQ